MIVTYALTGSRPPRDPERKRHIVVQRQVDERPPFDRGLFDQHRQPPDRLRADDDVGDAGRPAEQRAAFLLRHAAGDRHDRIVPLLAGQLTQLAEARVELLFRALPHAAGVDDDDVGIRRVVGRFEAGLLEQPRHALGVVHVHLAAERLDQVFARHVTPLTSNGSRERQRSQSRASPPCALWRLSWRFRLSPFRFRLSTSIRPA